jgi:hypothetical protein
MPYQPIIAIIATVILAAVLLRYVKNRQRAYNTLPDTLFRDISPLLQNPTRLPGTSAGTWKLQGEYQGHRFQIQSIIDTLATRKLPSLWLMVTLPEPQSTTATIDMMLRASGPTTFSNFDFLPHTLPTPKGFPEQATIRSDDEHATVPVSAILPHLDLFHGRRGKELLISPKGLRLVVQAAEADRARYGVFREANFGDTVIDAKLAQDCMNTLLALNKALN